MASLGSRAEKQTAVSVGGRMLDHFRRSGKNRHQGTLEVAMTLTAGTMGDFREEFVLEP